MVLRKKILKKKKEIWFVAKEMQVILILIQVRNP